MRENILINDEMKIALFIDSENTSAKYIDAIISEINKYGKVTYKRMYGNFRSERLKKWVKKSIDYEIVCVQNNTTGKNAADNMIIKAAKRILHRGNVDMFCIVSSDGDFTQLVREIKEKGMYVVGMGKSEASKILRNACNKYIYLDTIQKGKKIKDDKIEENINSEIEKNVYAFIKEKAKADVDLAMLGNEMHNKFPQFKYKDLGYSRLSKYIESVEGVELYAKSKNEYYIRQK